VINLPLGKCPALGHIPGGGAFAFIIGQVTMDLQAFKFEKLGCQRDIRPLFFEEGNINIGEGIKIVAGDRPQEDNPDDPVPGILIGEFPGETGGFLQKGRV
jgi:hypothetical protein